MSLLKSGPTKGRKRGDPWWGFSRRATGKPLGKTLNSSKWLGRHISKQTTPTATMRDPMTSPTPSRRWPPLLVSWSLMSMMFNRCGLAEKTSRSLTAWQKVPQRTSISLGGASHEISQDHGLKGNPFPQGPETVKWSGLPVVQERGTEWRHRGKPTAIEPLPHGLHLQPVPRVFHNQCWCYAPSFTAVQAGIDDDDDDHKEESSIDDNG